MQLVEQALEELVDAVGLDAIEMAARPGVDRGDLIGDRERLALLLVQHLDEALAACEGALGVRIEL